MNKSDFLFFSDLHIDNRKELSVIEKNGLGSRLNEGLFILDKIIDIVNKNKIKNVLILGDLFEKKDNLDNCVLLEVSHRINILANHAKIFYLLGNHCFRDEKYPNISIFSDQINIISKPCIKIIENKRIAFLPFQRKEAVFVNMWNDLHESNFDIFCFHNDLPRFNHITKKVSGLKLPIKKEVLYFAGHNHDPYNIENIQYLGSPCHVNFNDSGKNKYIWLFDSKTKKIEQVMVNSTKFITINYKDLMENNFLPTNINKNYVKITGEAKDWDLTIKNNWREKLEKEYDAKMVLFDVIVKKDRSPRKETIRNNEKVIEDYMKNIKIDLEKNKLIEIGNNLLNS